MVLGTRLSMCRSIMLLGKIAHHMWEVALLEAGGGEGVEQNLKREGKQYRGGEGVSLSTN